MINIHNKFTITDREITIYTHKSFQIIAIVLGIITIIPIIYIYGSAKPEISEDWINKSLPIILLTIFPILLLYYFGNSKIIINPQDEAIYKQILFSRKRLIGFSEIQNIRLAGGSQFCYRAFPKDNPYSKGIALTSETTNYKLFKDFEEKVLPLIMDMIAKSGYILNNEEKSEKITITDYKFYDKQGHIYKLKPYGVMHASILILIGIAVILFKILNPNTIETQFIFFALIPSAIGLSYLTRKKYFDINTKTFNTSHFFLIKKTYDLNRFQNFEILRKSTYGMYEGSDIIMILSKNPSPERVRLREIYNTKKIEQFIAETKNILEESFGDAEE